MTNQLVWKKTLRVKRQNI